MPPLGEQFTAAVTGLHAIGNILDRLFQATGVLKPRVFGVLGDEVQAKQVRHSGFRYRGWLGVWIEETSSWATVQLEKLPARELSMHEGVVSL